MFAHCTRITTLVAALATVAAGARAATFTVGADGSFTTVQAALDAAVVSPGNDEVRIEAGTYPETLSLALSADELAVTGGWNASFTVQDAPPEATVIDAGGAAARVLSIVAQGTAAVRVERLTLTGAVSPVFWGGAGVGLDLHGSASARLRFLVVRGNRLVSPTGGADVGGGGVHAEVADDASLEVAASEIADNSVECALDEACSSGGLYAALEDRAHVEIVGNQIHENRVSVEANQATGGGLQVTVDGVASAVITDNRIEHNWLSSSAGVQNSPAGAVWCRGDAHVQVRRNQWRENGGVSTSNFTEQLSVFADDGCDLRWSDDVIADSEVAGAILEASNAGQALASNLTVTGNKLGGVLVGRFADGTSHGGRVTLFNSIVYDNGPDLDAPDWVELGSNLVGVDPHFLDPAARVFRLASGSPAIDAGDDAPPGGIGPSDVEGHARLSGAHVDIGAYETPSNQCRVDRFGESPGIPAGTPLCSCVQHDFPRSFNCGFFLPDFFLDVHLPIPLPPGDPVWSDLSIHPWDAGGDRYQIDAALVLDNGKLVLPLDPKGRDRGTFKIGQDVSLKTRFGAPREPVVLRLHVLELRPGVKQPIETWLEVPVAPGQ